MKIEKEENLIVNYLQRIEKCIIVQKNWKISNQWNISEYGKEKSKELFKKINSSVYFKSIFKNCDYHQFLKHSEIDIIGVNTIEKSVFGVQLAKFNDDINEMKFQILEELFRTVLILQTYFSEFEKINAYFITPRTHRLTENSIRKLIEEANKLINNKVIYIKYISYGIFFTSEVDPIIDNHEDNYNISELLFSEIKFLNFENSVDSTTKVTKSNTDKTVIDGMKIGEFVQYHMRRLFKENLISKDEIKNLQDKDYSKKVFNQTYEILRSSDKELTGSDGRKRYYSPEKFFGDYHLNSQWVERHWKPFLNWLKKFSD